MSDGDYLRMLEDHKRIVVLEAALRGAEIMVGYLLEWARTSPEFRANPAETNNANITLAAIRAALDKTGQQTDAAPRITTNPGEKQEAEPQTAEQNMKPAT